MFSQLAKAEDLYDLKKNQLPRPLTLGRAIYENVFGGGDLWIPTTV